jgi:hypothetical protein
MEVRGGCRATGIYFEETADLAELYIENLMKKSGESLQGCHVLSALQADRTAEKVIYRKDF